MVDSNSHYYGPLSRETFDTLCRIDRALGSFFTVLDATLGKENYVVAVSADHGFPEAPEYRQSSGLPGRRIRAAEIDSLLTDARAAFDAGPDDDDARAVRVARVARQRSFVAAAYTPVQLAATDDTSDPYLVLYRHSFRPDRVPRLPLFSLKTGESTVAEAGVMLRLKVGAMINLDNVIHGSPYDYDRRVPMIFMGPGASPGERGEAVRTIDLAPTLAAWAHVAVPAGVDGRALELAKP
jgi:arylsulfatase A-like enzyme